MMKKMMQRGFTLIELLVVIAIIGILAATVLAALGTARSSGSDASVQGSVNSAKAQAELFFTTNNTYDGVCAAAASANGLTGLRTAIDNNSAASVQTPDTATAQTSTTIVCNDIAGQWALSAPMANGGGYFCADNTGFSGRRTTALAAYASSGGVAGGTQCPTS